MNETPLAMASPARHNAPTASAGLPATAGSAAGRLMQRGQQLVQEINGRARALLPYTEYAVLRLGRTGIGGVALLVFSTVFVLSTNSALHTELGALRAEAELDAARPGGAGTAALPPAKQLDGFLRSLPRQSDLPRVTAQLFEQAQQSGIELERGTYELLPARSGKLARYRISYPVKGTYPQVRRFVEGALAAAPAIELEGIRLTRTTIADTNIEADLRFVVMLRGS